MDATQRDNPFNRRKGPFDLGALFLESTGFVPIVRALVLLISAVTHKLAPGSLRSSSSGYACFRTAFFRYLYAHLASYDRL